MAFFSLEKGSKYHNFPEFSGGSLDLSKVDEDIEDPSVFLEVFIDSQVQFKNIADHFKLGKKINELKEFNTDLRYYTFAEYLKKNNHFFSNNLLNEDEYVSLIDEYNKFIKMMRDFSFDTTKELEHTLNDAKNLFIEAESFLKKLEYKNK
jgi:hypothetical protein